MISIEKKIKIIAGIFEKSFKKLNQELIEEFDFWNLKYGIGVNYNENFITGIFADFLNFSVQVSVFYVRNKFLWIGYANKNFHYFGDIDRALNL